MITIKGVDNGFIIEKDWKDPEAPNDIMVIEVDSTENEGIGKVLYAVADMLGVNYDKWADNNLRISFDKKGHKAE